MDPVDAPARLLESDEDADAPTPIARVAGEDTPPLYTLYGTSSIFVRVDDTQDDTQEESGKGHSQSCEQLDDQGEPTVMIVPVAALIRPSTGGCLPVCATVGFFTLLAAATGLFVILEDTPGANITPV